MSDWYMAYYSGGELRGTIGAHKCGHCGHHELVLELGKEPKLFIPLRPGMKIILEAGQEFEGEEFYFKPSGSPPAKIPDGDRRDYHTTMLCGTDSTGRPQIVLVPCSVIQEMQRKGLPKYPKQSPQDEGR